MDRQPLTRFVIGPGERTGVGRRVDLADVLIATCILHESSQRGPGAFSRVASMQRIPASEVGNALDRVEACFGKHLLVRSNRRTSELTPEGRAFLDEAGKLIESWRDLRLTVLGAGGGGSG